MSLAQLMCDAKASVLPPTLEDSPSQLVCRQVAQRHSLNLDSGGADLV